MLLQNDGDPSLKANDGFSLVHCALKGGNTSIINELLSRGLEADSRSNDYSTPLMAAAIGDKQNIFQMLIQKGADPSLKANNKEFSMLHSAAQGGNTPIINKLLSLGLDIDSRDDIGVTPLMIAAY
ncbi:unnamed protein product [Porites evermanni]|uniref:Ankyrin repeat protein n=1 Tax=Porites evermanni TaxID=104178 RepID=A0ABN8LF49_9CNID|nr:unnamed protein product [Porites evermanni]